MLFNCSSRPWGPKMKANSVTGNIHTSLQRASNYYRYIITATLHTTTRYNVNVMVDIIRHITRGSPPPLPPSLYTETVFGLAPIFFHDTLGMICAVSTRSLYWTAKLSSESRSESDSRWGTSPSSDSFECLAL